MKYLHYKLAILLILGFALVSTVGGDASDLFYDGILVFGNVSTGAAGTGGQVTNTSISIFTNNSASAISNLSSGGDGGGEISNASLNDLYLNLSGTNANQLVNIFSQRFTAGGLNITNASGTIAIFVNEQAFVGIGTDDSSHELDIHGHVEIEHTADQNDDHGLELILDAAGFGDVKGIFIDYITGATVAGQDEEVIFINLDQSAALGGDITGFEMVTTEGGANVTGLEVGVQINPVIQLSGIFSDMDSALSNGTDALAAFTSTTINITIFPSNDDTVIIGNDVKFEELEFLLEVVASGAGIRPVFYYSTGVDTWKEFSPADGTDGLRDTGVIIWLDEDIPDWEVGTGSEFLIRINRTQGGLGTKPVELKVQIAEATEYFWDKDGDILVRAVNATDWGNVSITESQIVDLDHNGQISNTSISVFTNASASEISNLTVGGTISNSSLDALYLNLSGSNADQLMFLSTNLTFVENFHLLIGDNRGDIFFNGSNTVINPSIGGGADLFILDDVFITAGDLILENNQGIFIANNTDQPIVVLKLGTTNLMTFGSTTVGGIRFSVAGQTNAMRVRETTGNLGVGVNVPDEKLEVIGNIHINDNDKSMYGNAKDAEIYYDGTNLVFATNVTGNGDAFFTRNVSATGYITRTRAWDTALYGNALDYIKGDYFETVDGIKEIDHSLYSPIERAVFDVSDPSNCWKVSEFSEDVDIDGNPITFEVVHTECGSKQEEGVFLGGTTAKLERALYEVNELLIQQSLQIELLQDYVCSQPTHPIALCGDSK